MMERPLHVVCFKALSSRLCSWLRTDEEFFPDSRVNRSGGGVAVLVDLKAVFAVLVDQLFAVASLEVAAAQAWDVVKMTVP